jgi:CDGSH-type Zn-finger protein
MKLPKVASERSIKIEVEQGKTYKWCACGLSQSQPFCDGSHAGTNFKPVLYTADESKLVGFCGCKQSKLGAICDGAHKVLFAQKAS